MQSRLHLTNINLTVKILTNSYNLFGNPLHWTIFLLRKCIPTRIKIWLSCSQVIDCFPLNQVKAGSFCFSDPVNRAGCGGLLVNTDCVRWWRWCALLCATAVFTSTFLRDALKTLDEFPGKASSLPFFFVGGSSVKALRSHGGVGWEPRRLY